MAARVLCYASGPRAPNIRFLGISQYFCALAHNGRTHSSNSPRYILFGSRGASSHFGQSAAQGMPNLDIEHCEPSVVAICGIQATPQLTRRVPRDIIKCCRDDMESRIAYVPLGPRNSFPFVPRDTVPAALARSLFFNLQVCH